MEDPVTGIRAPDQEDPCDPDLTRMLRALPDPVVVVDAKGVLRWGNTMAERLFGRSIHGTVGVSWMGYVHPEDLHFEQRTPSCIGSRQWDDAARAPSSANGWAVATLISEEPR